MKTILYFKDVPNNTESLITMDTAKERDGIMTFVGRYPTIKLGTIKLVIKMITQGIRVRRTGMRTQ